MSKDAQATGLKGWVGYRPEIKVLDCTIRDGGLMNDHKFNHDFVRAIYQADSEAGVDYTELGYKASKRLYARDQFGLWKFSDEEEIRRITGDKKSSVKISVMADAERTDYHTDILPKDKSVVDMVRVATYIHQIPTALDMIKDAHDKGYETAINLMAVSTVPDLELDNALEILCNSEVGTLYIVDSFGTFYAEQIQALMHKFIKFAKPAGKEIGIHTHNNMQLAFANTIEAIILGANMLDASLAGLGRGAGNCPMELLLSFLHNPKFDLRPVLECYINQHPRTAMKFMEETDGKDIVKFYDAMIEEE